MEKEKPITINADTARRMALNAERNPRQTQISGEASQRLNPIDGRPYAITTHFDGHQIPYSVPGEFELFDRNFLDSKKEKYSSLVPTDRISKDFYFCETKPLRTTPLIESQKALARIAIRQGQMQRHDYIQFLKDVNSLVRKYDEAGLPLESITDGNGFDAALRQVEMERGEREHTWKKFDGIIPYLTENIIQYFPDKYKESGGIGFKPKN